MPGVCLYLSCSNLRSHFYRLGVDLKSEIEFALKQHTANPFWHLTPKQIKRYNQISIDAAVEEQMHRQRIAEEERLAYGYF